MAAREAPAADAGAADAAEIAAWAAAEERLRRRAADPAVLPPVAAPTPAPAAAASPAAVALQPWLATAQRVLQLDAGSLDRVLHSLLLTQVTTALQPLKLRAVERHADLIAFGLRSLVHMASVGPHNATYGQRLLGVKYAVGTARQDFVVDTAPGSVRKTLHFLCQHGISDLRERFELALAEYSRQPGVPFQDLVRLVHASLPTVQTVIAAASLANQIAFLRFGRYATLADRLFGMRSVFQSSAGTRGVEYEFLTRELLWHGFTELLLFILPLIDVRRVTGIYRRIVGRLQALVVTFLRQRLGLQIGSSESTAAAVGAANPADSTPDPTPDHHTKGDAAPVLQSCAICSHRPAQSAYQTASCAHHFCYACIADATQGDPGFECPLCLRTVDRASLRRVSASPPASH